MPSYRHEYNPMIAMASVVYDEYCCLGASSVFVRIVRKFGIIYIQHGVVARPRTKRECAVKFGQR